MLLVMGNALYSMEDITVGALFSGNSSQNEEINNSSEPKLSKRKLADLLNALVEIPWKNLKNYKIDAEEIPETASYLIDCSSCGQKRSLYISKLDHGKKCALFGTKSGWEIIEKPKTLYDVEAKCPCVGICNKAGTVCTQEYTGIFELWQVVRIPENMKIHLKTHHPDLGIFTTKELKEYVYYRQSSTPSEVREIKKGKKIISPKKRDELLQKLEEKMKKQETEISIDSPESKK